MASEQKPAVHKLECDLFKLQRERDNIVQALHHIRVLREKSKIERLQVNSKIRELTAANKEKQKEEKTEQTTELNVSPPGPSIKPNISLIDTDWSFLDDPSYINQTQLNLDVVNVEEIYEEEQETDEE